MSRRQGGHVITKLPEQLVPLSNAVVPDYLEILPNGGVIESYLPVYSAITALVTLVFGTPWQASSSNQGTNWTFRCGI